MAVLRFLARMAAVVAIVVAVVVVAAQLALRRPAVAERAAALIGDLASSDELVVTLDGLDATSIFSPRLESLALADRSGEWLRIENLSLEIAPLALLTRSIRVRSISATRIEMPRMPEPIEEPFVLRPTRWHVRVERLRIDEVALGHALLGHEPESLGFVTPISVDAFGSVDLRRLTLDAEMVAATDNLDELLAPISVATSHARVTVKARGALARPGGVLTANVGRVEAGELYADGVVLRADVVRVGHGTPSYTVHVGGRLEGFRAPSPAGPHLGSDPSLVAELRFGATPDSVEVRNARLEGATFAAEAEATASGDGVVRVAQTTVVFPDLHATSELADIVHGGVLRLRANGEIRSTDAGTALAATVTGETRALELADSVLGTIAGPELRWRTELARDAAGVTRMSGFRLDAASFAVDADATLGSDDGVAAKATVDVADLDVFSPLVGAELGGAARIEAGLTGRTTAPEVRVTFRPLGARVGGGPEAIAGEVTGEGRLVAEEWLGRIGANLVLDGAPVGLTSGYRYDAQRKRIAIEQLVLSVPEATLAADGTIDWGAQLGRGRITLAAADLAPAGKMLGVPIGGAIDLVCDLTDEGRAQNGAIRGTATNVHFRGVEMDRLAIVAKRSGATRETRFSLEGTGRAVHAFEIEASGRHRGDLERADIVIDTLDGEVAGHAISATAPLTSEWANGTLDVRSLRLALSGGRAEGRWRGDLARGDGEIQLTGVPLALLQLVHERARLSGTMSGEIVRRRPGAPLEVVVRTEAASVPDPNAPSGATAFDLALAAEVSARRSVVDATIRSVVDGSALDVDLDAPAGVEGVHASGRVGATLRGRVEAGLIGQFLLPPDDRVGGALDLELVVSGTLEAPRIDGRVAGGIDYLNAAAGTELHLEEVELRGAGRRIDVVALSGHDGNGGTIRGSGTIELGSDWPSTKVDLDARFQDLFLAKIDELRLRGDGWVGLTARGGDLSIAGDFAANEAVVRIPNRLPPDVATLPVEHVHLGSSRRGAVAEETASRGRPVALDIMLRFPSRLRIEDPNLDSEWRGEVRVVGDTQDVDVVGALTIMRATFSLGGVRFRAREGTLSFDETNNVPVANFAAVASRNDIEATLRLTGRLDRIEFALTSEPPLPQDEILSRLMFGSTTGTLTAGQAVQLAQAVARLSGHGPQVDIMSRVRRFAGVDRIEIKETEGASGPATAVSVGKYVTDRIYVSVDQAVDGAGGKARVEVEVTERIAAETEIGQDENAAIGLKWRWNY